MSTQISLLFSVLTVLITLHTGRNEKKKIAKSSVMWVLILMWNNLLTSVMCLFNEHMADKHWYVLQNMWRRRREYNAKVFSILFLFMFHLFILWKRECQLNTSFHIVSFIFVLLAYWRWSKKKRSIMEPHRIKKRPHSPDIPLLSPLYSSFPFS